MKKVYKQKYLTGNY